MKRNFYFILLILLIPVIVNRCPAIDVAVVGQSELATRYRKHNMKPADNNSGNIESRALSLEEASKLPAAVVLPITVHGNSRISTQFTDSITLELIRSEKFDVVDRDRLKTVLQEQGFGQSGLVNPDRVSQIGRIVGADFIFVGEANIENFTDADGKNHRDLIERCTIRIIDVETSTVFAVIRKSPGTSWDWGYRMMYAIPLTLIWNSEDIHIKSTRYDTIAGQVVQKFINVLEHGGPGL